MGKEDIVLRANFDNGQGCLGSRSRRDASTPAGVFVVFMVFKSLSYPQRDFPFLFLFLFCLPFYFSICFHGCFPLAFAAHPHFFQRLISCPRVGLLLVTPGVGARDHQKKGAAQGSKPITTRLDNGPHCSPAERFCCIFFFSSCSNCPFPPIRFDYVGHYNYILLKEGRIKTKRASTTRKSSRPTPISIPTVLF